MERNFPNGRRKGELDELQMRRYTELRKTKKGEVPQTLRERCEAVDEFMSPLTSGEIIVAWEELLEDAFVSWILADENPEKVIWVEMSYEG